MIARRLLLAACLCGLVPLAASAKINDIPPDGGMLLVDARDSYADYSTGKVGRLRYLTFDDGALLTFGFGEVGQPYTGPPPVQEQARVLGILLGRLIAVHPELPARLDARLGDCTYALTAELTRRVSLPGANWDGRHGRPLRGQFGEVLLDELDVILRTAPIARAFRDRGYAIVVKHIGDIWIEPIGTPPRTHVSGTRHGPRSQIDIGEMLFEVDKIAWDR